VARAQLCPFLHPTFFIKNIFMCQAERERVQP
jgi:hypothetical protein